MKKITGCEIFNQVDNKYYTLYVEWFNSHFKVMLMESTMPPLSGKMDTKDVNYFCSVSCKSSDEYMDETKKILCGKNNEVQFFIQDKTLQWKRGKWFLGRIELHSVLDIKIVCESFQQLLKVFQNVQDKISTLEEENKNLVDTNRELHAKVEKMIEIKTTMEQDLYKKFIVILNSKKKRIRELEDAGREKQDTRDSIFNAPTDESEESEREDQSVNINPKVFKKLRKRKSFEDTSPESLLKNRKTDCVDHKAAIYKASSSKDYTNDEVCTTKDCERVEMKNMYGEQSCSAENRKSTSSLNFIEEESEEELFSQ